MKNITTKLKKVPKLRFREFSDEWEVKKLGYLINHKGGTALEAYVRNGGRYKFISIGNYTTQGQYIDNGQRIDPVNTKISERILKKGDLVMVLNDKTTSGDIIGSTILINADNAYVFNQRSEKITVKEDLSSAMFMWHKLNSRSFRKKIFSISQGGTQIYVNFPNVKKLEMALPNKSEQEKIAGFLGVVDERIVGLQDKKAAMEKYKKAIMQKIFSQKIRFKTDDGKNYPDWQEKKLGEIFDVTSSKRVYESDWRSSGIPFYRTREILSLINGVKIKEPLFITKELYKNYTSKYGKIQRGDMLVTGVGTIGKMYLVENDHKFYFKDGNVIWLKNNPNYSSKFVYYAFQTKRIRKQIEDNASITTVGTFTIVGAKKTSISIPDNIKEQQKIADFLTSIDNKLNIMEKELEQAKTFKKALLQQMFI